MIRAKWNGVVIAESNQTELLEGIYYFPPGTVKQQYLQRSAKVTNCTWKGTAEFSDLVVDGLQCENAAWTFPSPKIEVRDIRGYVAFTDDVEVTVVELQNFCMAGQ